MNVMPKTTIVSAYVRARELAGDHDSACAAAAQALGIDVDIVRGVVAEHLAMASEELA